MHIKADEAMPQVLKLAPKGHCKDSKGRMDRNKMSSVMLQKDQETGWVQTGFRAPFPPGYRASGVLLHVTSLPSPYGIGDIGPAAFAWVDQLAAAGQSWWQVLPLGPTGFGHSPYQALSSFAANPLIISPDQLAEEGLVNREDFMACSVPADRVDFARVIEFKESLLLSAWKTFRSSPPTHLRVAFEKFCQEKGPLQDSTATYMALRAKYKRPFQEWPTELVKRERKAMHQAKRELADEIDRFRFGQFLVLRQWQALRQHAHERGVRLLGDLPIFVAPDSADVWANPELFLLDDELRPRVVAGVPPDYFSAEGQLWGNPLYDWEALRQTDYRWWLCRLQARLEYLDAIRIDHFRGFESAWYVPFGEVTAKSGRWVAGPGADFFEKAREALKGLPLMAEDLGVITPAVAELRDRFELPGMRVLEFAFSGDHGNPHLPHNHPHNAVVYTGTHDNDTVCGWYDSLPEHERKKFWDYVGHSPNGTHQVHWEMVRLANSSPAALAITPLQDLLGLGSAARMNVPGQANHQWRWRWQNDEPLRTQAFERLYDLTRTSGRLVEATGRRQIHHKEHHDRVSG